MVCIFCLLIFVLQCIAIINLVEGLLLPFLYIHTCVIFNKCIQTLIENGYFHSEIHINYSCTHMKGARGKRQYFDIPD